MSIRFGGYFPPFPIWDGAGRITKSEQKLHRHIDVVMWYQWWGVSLLAGGKRTTQFRSKWLNELGDRTAYIKWEPWKPGKHIVQPRFALKTIEAGDHDEYIREWATRIRNYGRTVYLSPLPEMNGFWNQWSIPVGKHTPEDFIAAWRHIHDIFRTEGCTNVRFVWAPNAGDMPPEYPMELFYPGSDYVDVLGLSVYNWGTARSWSTWRSFEDIIKPYYDRIIQLGDQPVWIAEMGCTPVGGDKAAWIRAALAYMPQLSRLETIIWFDMKKEADWRISIPGIASEF